MGLKCYVDGLQDFRPKNGPNTTFNRPVSLRSRPSPLNNPFFDCVKISRPVTLEHKIFVVNIIFGKQILKPINYLVEILQDIFL